MEARRNFFFFSGKLLPCDASDQRLLTMTSDNEAIF